MSPQIKAGLGTVVAVIIALVIYNYASKKLTKTV